MEDDIALNNDRVSELHQRLRSNASPRHVPTEIMEVGAIPYTSSGKKLEKLVSRIVNGRDPGSLSVVSNPDSLNHFKQMTNPC